LNLQMGNSLAVRIPKALADAIKASDGSVPK
jgi:antitoxin component of MazEF toxin-antitoxin module